MSVVSCIYLLIKVRTMATFEWICGILAVLFLLYYWSIATYGFWKSRNIPGPTPVPLLGNFADVFRSRKSIIDSLRDYYQEYSTVPICGLFIQRRPLLLLRDLDLIKDILIRDFSKFSDRGLERFEKADPLSQHLAGLEHARWRPLRNKLSPAFTSGKLREMFYLLLECGDHFQTFLDKCVAKNATIECRELTARFTTDVIGTCAFGLQMNAMAEEDSEFRKMGKYVSNMDWKKIIKFRIRESAPWLFELLAPIMKDSLMTDFFINTMKDTIDYRRKNKVVKHDFIDQIMEIQDHPEKIPEVKLSDAFLASQLFVFFLAGFETSSMTMSNALYELAQHHDCQDRLREEIQQVLNANGDKLTYETVKSMPYLDKVFKETLRKFPPAGVLLRRSVSSYTFSNIQLTIPEDTLVMISTLGIHRDPNIYSEPEKFDPERFDEAAVASRHPMSFLGFGDGPRNCIGARFANLQTKVGLIKILQRYRVNVCEQTEIPYEIAPYGTMYTPIRGIYLKFTTL